MKLVERDKEVYQTKLSVRKVGTRSEAQVDDCNWQILLQKSFWGSERKFLEPLVRFTRGDVRDHIVSSKIDHGRP